MDAPDNLTSTAVLLLLAKEVARLLRGWIRYRQTGRTVAETQATDLKIQQYQLELLQKIHSIVSEDLRQSSSVNRKLWRKAHPGNDTPMPVEEGTHTGELPEDIKRLLDERERLSRGIQDMPPEEET